MTRLVLLSGWGIDARIWHSLAPYWPDDIQVTTPDWPGYSSQGIDTPAGDPPPETLAPEDMAGLGRRMAMALPADAVWVGWSLGGLLACALLAHLPPPRTLVMLGMGARFCATDGVTPEELATFRRAFARNPKATWQHFLRWQLQGEPAPRTAHRRLLDLIGRQPSASHSTLSAGLTQLATLDIAHLLAAPPCRVLHMAGQQDPLLSPAARCAADVTFGATGHCPMLTRPDQLASRLVAIARHAGCEAGTSVHGKEPAS
ncbi:alpha/beta fold hydrolase [Halomonas sp. BC04]|uniref:alpha/beta fold hydrolase n=1 Tax=Halomonas sp. BC04 TaxID=1403540 RepID=UPI0003ED74CE|nr:alpha/beta fold hydrolase [Halomonas sp. BC04]EWG97765.1 alpha/beta hydrolase [Halomonas sp. BC04]